jgi:hypothetical protein
MTVTLLSSKKMKMIKNVAASILMLGAMLTMTSCEKEDFKYSGENFIHYQKTTYSANENDTKIINIPVFLATTNHPGTVTANVTVGGEAVQGQHYTIIKGQTLTFGKGIYSDTIKVKLIDNEVVDGNKKITFTIGENSAKYTVGYPNSEGNAGITTLTIVDNDCPYDVKKFLGTYTATYTTTSGAADGVYKSTITQDPIDPNVLLVGNFWGDGKTVRVTMNPTNLTTNIVDQVYEAVNYYGYGPATIASLAPTVAPVGTITPCEGKFTVTFRVSVAAGGWSRKATFTR